MATKTVGKPRQRSRQEGEKADAKPKPKPARTRSAEPTAPKASVRKAAEAPDSKAKSPARAKSGTEAKTRTKTKATRREPAPAEDNQAHAKPHRRSPASAQDSRIKTEAKRPGGEKKADETGSKVGRRSVGTRSRKTRQETASDGHLARAAEPQAMTGGQVPSVPSEIGGAGAGTEPRPQADRPAVRIASALHQALESFARSHELGHVTGETRFDWGEIENPDLHPDLAFVSFDRWAAYRHVPTALTWHVVPDLVVEVLDESEKTEEIGPRLSDYFRAGVNRIWVVDPRDLRVFDYQSASEYEILSGKDRLSGGRILPGFEVALEELGKGHE